MNGHIVPLDADTHHRVQALLPWFAAGRLDAREAASVEAHLFDCPRCQAEWAAERRLREAYREMASPSPDIEPAFAAMSARLDSAPPGTVRRLANLLEAAREALSRIGAQWRGAAGWLRWGVAGQCAVLVLMALHAAMPAPATYRLLGRADARGTEAGNVVVQFRAEARESDLRRVLKASGARLVDGPTAADAYLLQVPDAALLQSLARLRAEPAIRMAEALGPAAPP